MLIILNWFDEFDDKLRTIDVVGVIHKAWFLLATQAQAQAADAVTC